MKNEYKAWTDVEVKKADNRVEFSVWGRSYIFDNSFLPVSVISMGEELLASPITMTAGFARGNFSFPKEIGIWEDFTYILADKTDEKAVLLVAAKCCELVANATITVEFDGFVKIDFRIVPSRNALPELEKLYLDIPLSNSMNLFHYWPNDIQSILPAKDVMNSGELADIALPFKPYIWAGNEKVGLGIFVGESQKNFECPSNCIHIKDNNIRINILDTFPKGWKGHTDRWVESLKPLTYTFGFHATPVKEYVHNSDTYRRMHFYRFDENTANDETVIDRIAAAGVKYLILHEAWALIQNYGMPADENSLTSFINKCHERGVKVLLYFGYEYSMLAPDWNEKCEDYLTKTVTGNFTGGWQRKPWQRDFIACYRGGYADELLKRVEYALDTYGADGIYTDGTYVPWECANEGHGCGYRDANGILHTSYPVLPVREFVKRLYETVHKRGGIIDTHQSSCCIMPTLSFCDSYYDGENIQQMMNDDDMSFLNLAAFRAEFMGVNLGIPTNFICQAGEGSNLAGLESLESLTLLHNVHSRPQNLDSLDYATKMWNLFDELKLDDAAWHPYWDNKYTDIVEENAYTCVYDSEKGTVIYAVDFIGNREITMVVPENITKITNYQTKDTYTVTDGKVKLSLDFSKPYFFVAEK